MKMTVEFDLKEKIDQKMFMRLLEAMAKGKEKE